MEQYDLKRNHHTRQDYWIALAIFAGAFVLGLLMIAAGVYLGVSAARADDLSFTMTQRDLDIISEGLKARAVESGMVFDKLNTQYQKQIAPPKNDEPTPDVSK